MNQLFLRFTPFAFDAFFFLDKSSTFISANQRNLRPYPLPKPKRVRPIFIDFLLATHV